VQHLAAFFSSDSADRAIVTTSCKRSRFVPRSSSPIRKRKSQLRAVNFSNYGPPNVRTSLQEYRRRSPERSRLHDIAYLDVEAKKLEKRRLHFGDIILEKSGGGPNQPVGRVVLFDKEDGDFSFSNFTAALRVLNSQELDFRFVHKFLHWSYLSGVTEGMQSHSTGIRNLNFDAYKSIKISWHPRRSV
jgi:hypothetical protein